MIRILFVCHGNICRSPMAEFILKNLVREKHLEDLFEISSAATSTEEIGNPVYPPAKAMLAKHGISCSGKYARQIKKSDYEYYDLIIGMDSYNMRNLNRFYQNDPENKIKRLLDYSSSPHDVSDPWYSDDFETAWSDISEGCHALLDSLSHQD